MQSLKQYVRNLRDPKATARFNKLVLNNTTSVDAKTIEYVVQGGGRPVRTPFSRTYNIKVTHYCNKSSWMDNPGVYLISSSFAYPHKSAKDKSQSRVSRKNIYREVKVGLAKFDTTLGARVDSYLTYWPAGVMVYGAVFLDKTYSISRKCKTTCRKIARDHKHQSSKEPCFKFIVQALEAYAHNYFKHRNRRYRQGLNRQLFTRKTHTHLSEWFVLSPSEIQTFLKSCNPAGIVREIQNLEACYTQISSLLSSLKVLCKSHRNDMQNLIKIFIPSQIKTHGMCVFKSSFDKRSTHARNQRLTRAEDAPEHCFEDVVEIPHSKIPTFTYHLEA